MSKRQLLPASLAALLLALSLPAAAITVNFNSLLNGIVVESDTAAYDSWASNCPNVKTDSSGNPGAGCDYHGLSGMNNTLFFWGDLNSSTNTVVDLTWRGSEDSPTINSVRLLSLTTDDQSVAPVMGPQFGPLDFNVEVPSSSTLFPIDFDNSPRTTPPGNSLTPPATKVQGQGVFYTYGRDSYTPNQPAADQPLRPFTTSTLSATVKLPGKTASQELALDPGGFEFDGSTLTAQPGLVDASRNLSPTQQGTLAPDQILELRLANPGGGGGGSPPPPAHPQGYMDDVIVLLNQNVTGAQAGMQLMFATDVEGLDYSRTGANAENIEATLRRRVDGAVPGDLTGSLRVFNQGATDSFISGDASVDVGGNMSSTDAGAKGTADMLPGEALAPFDFELDGADRLTASSYTLQADGTIDVAATRSTPEHSMRVGVVDNAGDQTYAQLAVQDVGPLIAAASPDAGARYFAPNNDDYTVDLGSVEINTQVTKSLTIANLFGTDFGELTDLTFYNVTGERGFDDQSTFDFGNGSAAADSLGAGDIATLLFQLDAPATAGAFTARITFFTNQDLPFNTLAGNANQFWFDVLMTATDPQQTPIPGSAALLGLGLAGLAGVLARRRWVAGRVGGGV
jgi:hypothetical protein